MKKIFTIFCFLFGVVGQASWGQIVSDGLNNTTTLFTLTNGAYYTGNSATGDRVANSPFAVEGTHSRGVSNATATLTSSDINTTGYTGVAMSFRLAAFSIGSTGNGVDNGDIVTVEISPDGGTNYYSTVRVLGSGNAYWSYAGGTGNASTAYDGNATPVNFQPAAGGNRTTDGYSTVTVTSMPIATNVRVRITLLNNDTAERWLVDDFKVTGTVAGTPTITLSSPSQVSAGNIAQCSTNNILSAFEADVTVANATLNSVAVTTAGTYSASSHFSNFKLFYNTTNTFGTATQIGTTQASVASGGNITFSGFTQSIIAGGAGSDGFFWIVADVNASATAGQTINITASPTLTFASGVPTGTITVGGTQTIISSGVTAPTGVSASSGNGQSIVTWTNPTCFEEVMIVGKQGAFTATTPTGDGTAYTASLTFGSGTAFDGGFVVYKGATSSQTVTNLTNCLAYEFKIFARKGTTWSVGVTANATPTSTASSLSDVVAVASSEANTISSLMNTATISTATDGVQVWQITIRDGGATMSDADCLPTIVNSIVLTQSGGNGVTNWNNIQSIAIFNGSTFLANGTVATSSITFSASPLISVPDNGSVTLSIRLSLKSTLTIPATADGADFGFSLTNGNFTTASSATSSQKNVTTQTSTNAQNVIEVIATKLTFITQPSNANVGATMTSPTVEAEDANGNRDRDYVTNINIVSTGSLDVTPKTATPASGLATFSNIIHTISGTGLTLTATSGSLTSAVSNTFNILTVINSENFGTCGSLTWNAVNVLGATDVWSCGTSQMLMNGFGSENDEDWLIVATPINFNAYANEVMTFVTQERFNGPNLELYYSTDFSGTFDATNVSSATWTLISHTWNDTSTGATLSGAFNNTVNLSSLTGTAYIAFKYTGTSGLAEEWIVDNISITGTITSATLTASPNTRTGFTYAQGAGPSTSQNFSLSGINLTPSADNITITPPTNYEISTDNVTFTSSDIVIAYTGGALASTPIYIRLKAGLTVGNYNGELINISGGGASGINVTCSGNVYILPQVTLSSPNPAIASYNIIRGTTNNVISRFDLAVADADATLTNVSFTTGGTYAASNLTNIKIWYSPDATFTASGNDVQLRSKTTNLKTNPQTFTAFSQTITAGSIGYFFLTTDVVCGAGEGNTISVDALTTSDITVTLGNKTGASFASGTHTFVASTPNDITSPTTSSCQNGGTTVGWTLPTGCYDAVLVFATSGSFTSALPTGNGSAYTANTAFGSGTGFDGGFCVYKGTGTSVNVTGLTNGTNYTYKIFMRSSSLWSNGVTVNCTPTVGYCTSNGDGADGFNTGVRLVNFNTINNATGDIDNAYSDFTAISTSVSQNTTYNLTVNVNTAGNYTVYTRAWIDWNQDGDFLDTGEEYNMGTAVNVSNGATTFSPTSITVPLTAVIGTTRMRISARYNTVPTSCGTGFDGEVEDYTLVISGPCTPTHTITSFFPTSGSIGTMVLINGTGFSASSTVMFGTISATSVTFLSSTQIVAEVPTGFTTANIKIMEASCEQTSVSTFTRTEASGACYAPVSGLIISELYDGFSGSLGYIEIYNGTNATIDLTTYSIDRFNDNAGGATHTYTFPASGVGSSIASGQVLVGKVSNDANTAGITPHFTFTGSTAGYNELDRLELKNGGTKIDEVIAQGVDVGYSYFRKVTVTAPNPTFDANEWTFVTTENTTDIGVFAPNLAVNITTNPADVTTCSFNMSVTATSSSSLTYQWYFNDRTAMTGWQTVTTANLTTANASNSAVTVSGATSNSLTLTGTLTSLYNYQFYCEVSNGGCMKLSNAAQFVYESRPIYRSVASVTGDWTTTANWEMANSTAGPWISACTYPISSNSTEVIIQTGTNITLDVSLAIDKITVENGATFAIASSSLLTLNNGSTGSDLIVNGTFLYHADNTKSIAFSGGATWDIASNGTIIKTNGASTNDLRDNYEGGISNIPTNANWIFRYIGNSIAIATTNMFYPNLTFESTAGFWDATSIISKFTGSTGGYATVKGNLDIGGTGTGTVQIYNENYNTQPMLILGNVTVRANNILTNNGSTDKGRGFEIRGNLVVDGTLIVNATDVNVTSPILKFSGTTAEQTISGAGTLNVHELEVNKTAALDLKLLRNIAIGNLLDIQVGDVNLNGFNIDMGTTATLSEIVSSNYLVKDLTATTEASKGGYVRFTNRNVNATQTSIGGSRLSLNRTTGSDYTVNIDRYHYVADNGKAAIRLIYAVAVNTGTMGMTNIRIDYADAEMMPAIEPFDVARWSSATGWQNFMASSKSAASNYSQLDGRTSFSHWTLRDTNVLLASSTDLQARQTGEQESTISWQAVSVGEVILQKSLDGKEFENLATTEKGEFVDINFTQSAYYRVKTTKNTQVNYSNIVFVPFVSGGQVSFFPNPFRQGKDTRLILPEGEQVRQLLLTNMQGKQIQSLDLPALPTYLDTLPKGLYILQVRTDKNIYVLKIVKE